jgi:membrane protein DedA with SNARE-associated domain
VDLNGVSSNLYVIVVLAAALDATALPFPGRLVLAGAGAITARDNGQLLLVIALGTVAALAVDHLWYFAGSIARGPLLRLVKWLTARSERGARRTAQEYFERWGALTFVVGRFVAVVRIVAWPLARTTGISYPRFLALDAFAAALWTSTWVGLGYFLGPRLWAVMERFGLPLTIAIAVLGTVGGLLGVRLLRRRGDRRAVPQRSRS